MSDISAALKRLDAIAASAGIEQQQQPAITLADLDVGLAELKALADKHIAETLKLDSQNPEAEHVAPDLATQNPEAEHVAPDLAALKQAMADAHPDRGGTDAAFIEARERYVEAKQTLPETT
jgi:hypothetical protein